MSVTVEQWVVDAIDEVKPALAALGRLGKNLVEAEAKARIT